MYVFEYVVQALVLAPVWLGLIFFYLRKMKEKLITTTQMLFNDEEFIKDTLGKSHHQIAGFVSADVGDVIEAKLYNAINNDIAHLIDEKLSDQAERCKASFSATLNGWKGNEMKKTEAAMDEIEAAVAMQQVAPADVVAMQQGAQIQQLAKLLKVKPESVESAAAVFQMLQGMQGGAPGQNHQPYILNSNSGL